MDLNELTKTFDRALRNGDHQTADETYRTIWETCDHAEMQARGWALLTPEQHATIAAKMRARV